MHIYIYKVIYIKGYVWKWIINSCFDQSWTPNVFGKILELEVLQILKKHSCKPLWRLHHIIKTIQKWNRRLLSKPNNQTTLVSTNPKPNSNGYLKVRGIEENNDWLNSIASFSLIYVLNKCKPLGEPSFTLVPIRKIIMHDFQKVVHYSSLLGSPLNSLLGLLSLFGKYTQLLICNLLGSTTSIFFRDI